VEAGLEPWVSDGCGGGERWGEGALVRGAAGQQWLQPAPCTGCDKQLLLLQVLCLLRGRFCMM